MAEANLYEVAIVHRVSSGTDKGKTTVVLAPKAVLAQGPDHAKLLAGREIPEDYDADKLADLEITVRPFRGTL